MSFETTCPPVASFRRNATIAMLVLALHALALTSLQAGLKSPSVEIVVPVAVISRLITPAAAPAPEPAPPAPVQPPEPKPVPPKPAPESVKPKPAPPIKRKPIAPAPRPVERIDPAPAIEVPVSEPTPAVEEATAAPAVDTQASTQPTTKQQPSQSSASNSAAAATGTPAPALTQPSSSASYLNNPPPVYPAVSRRLGEQGAVLLNVLIGTDGRVQKIEVKQSSGFDRLDRQALSTVSRWRFVPGTRNGTPEAMWYQQPIHFVLTQ
ncbi:hypothetical protein GCM10022279_32460 [Comamonas faecalis]|uniref:TonB C-terminal domain-containing protein n=1 Tax=Comamonas faecalis TaxID=1387849 RepID=A0ABP7S2V6_9BURK